GSSQGGGMATVQVVGLWWYIKFQLIVCGVVLLIVPPVGLLVLWFVFRSRAVLDDQSFSWQLFFYPNGKVRFADLRRVGIDEGAGVRAFDDGEGRTKVFWLAKFGHPDSLVSEIIRRSGLRLLRVTIPFFGVFGNRPSWTEELSHWELTSTSVAAVLDQRQRD